LMVRRFSPRVEAALASFILALSYHHVFYSQDARGYTAMLFGGLLATLALIEALEHRSPWAWVVYCGGMLICVGSVAIGSVVLAGHLLAVTFLRPNLVFYVVFAITGWLLLHLYFFVIPDILGFIFGDYTRPEGGWHFSGAFVEAILQGLRLGPVSVPILAAEAILVATGIGSYVRQDRLFAALLLGPELILLLLLASLGVAFEPRFFIYVLPVVIVFTARGTRCVIEMFASRLQFWSYAAAFTCVLAVSIFLLRTWWRFPMQDFVGARHYVESRLSDGDAIVAIGMAGAGYRFYYWPQITVENRVSGLLDVMDRSPRVWLLCTFVPDMDQRRPKLMRFVLDHFLEEGVFPGRVVDGDIHVYLYARTDMSDWTN
jgi:mannosyltransferase